MKSSDHISRKALLKDLRQRLAFCKQYIERAKKKDDQAAQLLWFGRAWLLESLIAKYDPKA